MQQGDATASEGGEGDRARRAGPRHAAPRKSLLAKLQRPAGKAIALAAMPTAVLVGMGFTPRPALAEGKDIPYAPGPCVTRSDDPAASASPPSSSQSPSPSAVPTGTPAPTASPTSTGPPPAGGEPAPDTPPPAPTAPPPPGDGAPTTKPAPTPDDQKPDDQEPANPLDPLGLGDAIDDLLDGLGRDRAPAPDAGSPSPAASGSPSPDPKPSSDRKPDADADAGEADSDSGSGGDSDPAADKTRKAIEEAAEQAGARVEELDEDAKGLDATEDEDIPDGAKPPFPCPTPDPEALAAAKPEEGRALLPDDPWVLKSSKLTLTGLDYHGIVEVGTGGGKVKKVLKFTAESIDIKDLHQLAKGPSGTTMHVEADPGSTSTIRHDTVTMYTEELKGDLFGIIPVTFSPATPPPVNVPFAFFTDVTVTQAGQFGGTLTVPGLHSHLTDDGTTG